MHKKMALPSNFVRKNFRMAGKKPNSISSVTQLVVVMNDQKLSAPLTLFNSYKMIFFEKFHFFQKHGRGER